MCRILTKHQRRADRAETAYRVDHLFEAPSIRSVDVEHKALLPCDPIDPRHLGKRCELLQRGRDLRVRRSKADHRVRAQAHGLRGDASSVTEIRPSL